MRTALITFLAAVLIFGLSVDASAQKRRKKKAPLPMPTPVVQPVYTEPSIVSRASEEADLEDYLPRAQNSTATGTGTTQATDPVVVTPVSGGSEDLAQQVRELSTRINSMDARQKLLLDLQILSSAEQRSETLRKQLLDLNDKEAAIRPRLEDIEYEIRPEVIERNAAFIGSLRPEEVRENMRRKLATERDRLNLQLTQIAANRTSLEASVQSADSMVVKLRAKLEADLETQVNNQAVPAKKP